MPPGIGSTGDPQIDALIERESTRRRTWLQLLASETEPTSGVRAAMASTFDSKYAEGRPGSRYHGGCEVVDELEELAIGRARDLFGAGHVDVQPLSGSAANLAVHAAFAQPGDPVLALRLEHGGHQTHGSRANFSGRWFSPLHYEVRRDDELVDYDQVRELALVHRPRMLVAGATSYSRSFDYPLLREIADEAECILLVDAAHLAGHVAAGLLPSPVPHADVVTFSTNKVFRGPRGGVILARTEHADALRKAVHPFIQGGPSMHAIAAKAVTFHDAGTEEFADYVRATARIATDLADALTARGLRVVSGGTDIHLAVVDVAALGISGSEAQDRLNRSGIVVDKAVLPFDERPVAEGSGIRIGTPAATSRGLTADMIPAVADAMLAAMSTDDLATHDRIHREISSLACG
ncbi:MULTISPECIES: serine hydroxymethyltransferase [Gordonia]|jgi:glycine hydroxymethyltransferase|uniref:serine hydroxymethyltransferase n=1 Tax=Gordonia TaxID=2053 RepID=UPI0009DB02CF|nr:MULTISPECIES: serine hydroxymethyltransferase [Gordonia]MDH3005580.1 serine hydroxymethyltransferase [Gordonia alkanivorans]MDH3010123.1 serine hydroxymethyltransferase [Gordonia alkanivorans]MDH3014993.1 serine hydroxymethyltransferase [Gordonia alkanivorans]MDH3023214.1 serine hydroxymethyltransferase [Gordonia alkanivorans]MDH3039386.1 serine hydroxymethyltransferase [Gordonia alkanivorans]